jgi:chromosome segregation ATPase
LQTERDELDEALTAARREIDSRTDRITSLEVAHMASLQHSAEQEDSLIRWQELAEMTEKRAQELSDELEKVQYQMEESQSTIELLRQHRTDLERELDKALSELEELRKRNTEPIVPPAALAAATEKIFRLEGQLEKQEQKYTDQIRYYRSGLEKTQAALTAVQEQLENQEEELTDLREKVSVQAALLQQWQTAVTEKEAALQRQSELFARKQELMNSEKKNLQITLRESKAQLEAYEDEVAQYVQMTQNQGRHLAEVQSRLVERELQLKQAMARLEKTKAMIEKQNSFIKEMKRVTKERIQNLQTQIARLQKSN